MHFKRNFIFRRNPYFNITYDDSVEKRSIRFQIPKRLALQKKIYFTNSFRWSRRKKLLIKRAILGDVEVFFEITGPRSYTVSQERVETGATPTSVQVVDQAT